MVYDRTHFTLRLFLGVCLCFLVVVVFYCACVGGLDIMRNLFVFSLVGYCLWLGCLVGVVLWYCCAFLSGGLSSLWCAVCWSVIWCRG